MACQIQTFGETQHFSQTEWRDTFIASVDPPLIQFKRKTGMSKRRRVREIREKTWASVGRRKVCWIWAPCYCVYLTFCGWGNPDMELALKIQRRVAFSYQKESKKSKCMFSSVIQSEQTLNCDVTNPSILTARSYFSFVADHTNRKSVAGDNFFNKEQVFVYNVWQRNYYFNFNRGQGQVNNDSNIMHIFKKMSTFLFISLRQPLYHLTKETAEKA